MEFTVVEGLRTLKLDLVLTLALAAVFLFVGAWLQGRVGPLRRASIPAAAVGGLLFALLVWALRSRGGLGVALDTSLRAPLQIAFFTTIGFGATLSLLRAGGARMILFFVLASLTAVAQNAAGIGVAKLLNAPPALGIICGSLTLTGGPATGLAFTSLFEQKGVAGAGALIIASATFGIFVASIVGNPVATALVRRFRLAPQNDEAAGAETKRAEARTAEERAADQRAADEQQFWAVGSMALPEDDAEAEDNARAASRSAATPRGLESADEVAAGESSGSAAGGGLLRHLLILLAVMGVGALVGLGLSWLGTNVPPFLGVRVVGVGRWLSPDEQGFVGRKIVEFGWWLYKFRFILPAYVGAMIVAAVVRNVDDRRRWLRLDARALELLGVIALALFLVIALMDLKLWQLAGLAVPMLVILAAQVVLTVLYAVLVVFTLMGRDYEAAVTTSGHIGFGLGVTPNAVANMEALVARFGPAPRSFLYVPVVGAFFIDFSNALVITLFANMIG